MALSIIRSVHEEDYITARWSVQRRTEKIWHEPQTLGLEQPATARLALPPAD